MKVFLSWSGELSHKIALELRDWLPFVIQSIQPYVSSEDIDKGTRWSIDIAKELEDSSFGVLCVTPQNLEAPWINFEAGALSKAFNNSNVSPFLFGLKPSDLKKSPLLQFQSTLYDKKDFIKLILSLNNALGKEKLDETKLKKTFDVWWENLKTKLDTFLPEASAAIEKVPDDSPQIAKNEALEEILELTREQHKLLRNPEAILPFDYLNYVMKKSNIGFTDDRSLKELHMGIRRLRNELSSEEPDLGGVENAIQRIERVLHNLTNQNRNRRNPGFLFE